MPRAVTRSTKPQSHTPDARWRCAVVCNEPRCNMQHRHAHTQTHACTHAHGRTHSNARAHTRTHTHTTTQPRTLGVTRTHAHVGRHQALRHATTVMADGPMAASASQAVPPTKGRCTPSASTLLPSRYGHRALDTYRCHHGGRQRARVRTQTAARRAGSTVVERTSCACCPRRGRQPGGAGLACTPSEGRGWARMHGPTIAWSTVE